LNQVAQTLGNDCRI